MTGHGYLKILQKKLFSHYAEAWVTARAGGEFKYVQGSITLVPREGEL